ncbi:MAG: hypothetical protein U9P10_10215 [Thermodesulfobacteriota bacterium]|nr:hypothetical protein [Thermodesulfobacteriota bacterium]
MNTSFLEMAGGKIFPRGRVETWFLNKTAWPAHDHGRSRNKK